MTLKEEIINSLALVHGLSFSMVTKIIAHQAITIKDVITTDDPDVSVKVNYWGKFETLPYRRKKVQEMVEAKKLREEQEEKQDGLINTRR